MARLKCPNCANVIEAPAGGMPRCPACGFMGSVTAPPATLPAAPFTAAQLQRPGWVLAVAILQFISGGFAILGGMVVAFFGTLFAAFLAAFFAPLGALGGLIVLIGLVMAVFGVLYVLLAVQVLKGREWARVLSIVLSGVSAAFNVLGLMGGNPMALFSIAFDALIIVGLCLPETRAWFARQEQGQRVPAAPA